MNGSAPRIDLIEAHATLPRSEVWLRVHTVNGSTNTAIGRFTTTVRNTGTAITYADSVTLGASFTINEDGLYSIYHGAAGSPAVGQFGISLNSTQLTTTIGSITAGDIVAAMAGQANDVTYSVARAIFLSAGSVIRPHMAVGYLASGNAFGDIFSIAKVNN
jgi:hypothetical protein